MYYLLALSFCVLNISWRFLLSSLFSVSLDFNVMVHDLWLPISKVKAHWIPIKRSIASPITNRPLSFRYCSEEDDKTEKLIPVHNLLYYETLYQSHVNLVAIYQFLSPAERFLISFLYSGPFFRSLNHARSLVSLQHPLLHYSLRTRDPASL